MERNQHDKACDGRVFFVEKSLAMYQVDFLHSFGFQGISIIKQIRIHDYFTLIFHF